MRTPSAPRRETHAHPQPSFRKRNPHRVADSTLPVPFNSLPKSYVRAIPGLRPNIAAWSEAPDGSEFLTDSIHSLNDVAVPEEDTESGANREETNNGEGGEEGESPARTASPRPSAVVRLSANLDGPPPRAGSPAPKPPRLSGTLDGDEKTLWIGRAKELASLFANNAGEDEGRDKDGNDVLKSVAAIETEDTKPGVFFLSGSSGVAGDTLRYLRMLASIGHLVMCPDDFCGWPARLRHRRPAVIQPSDPANYWTNNLLYAEDSFATGELVYESCAEKYTSSNRLSVVYDATLKAKHAAMTGALLRLPDTMRRRGIVLAGNSEGAIVLGMMDDAMLELDSTLAGSPNEKNDETKGEGLDKDGTQKEPARLLGRINIAYSLEPNYFTYRTLSKVQGLAGGTGSGGVSVGGGGGSGKLGSFGAIFESEPVSDPSVNSSASTLGGKTPSAEPRGLFGSAWRVDVPTLCVNGSEDQFFGRRKSVSSAILQRAKEQEAETRQVGTRTGSQTDGDLDDDNDGAKNMAKNMETWRRGDRPNITGDAGQRMSELGMTRAFVAQMEGARHAMCDTHDLALYKLLAEFLSEPDGCASIAERWAEDDVMKEYVLWRAKIVKDKSAFASMASSDEVAWRRGEKKGGSGSGRRRGRLFHPSASSFLDLTSSFASLVTAQRTTPPSSPSTGGSLADFASKQSDSAPSMAVDPSGPRRYSVDSVIGVPPAASDSWGRSRNDLGLAFDDRADAIPKPDNPRKISVDDDGTFRRMPSPLPPQAMPSPPPSPPRTTPTSPKKNNKSSNCVLM